MREGRHITHKVVANSASPFWPFGLHWLSFPPLAYVVCSHFFLFLSFSPTCSPNILLVFLSSHLSFRGISARLRNNPEGVISNPTALVISFSDSLLCRPPFAVRFLLADRVRDRNQNWSQPNGGLIRWKDSQDAANSSPTAFRHHLLLAGLSFRTVLVLSPGLGLLLGIFLFRPLTWFASSNLYLPPSLTVRRLIWPFSARGRRTTPRIIDKSN